MVGFKVLRDLEVMGMENFQKVKKLDIDMRSWKAVQEVLAEMERWISFWDQPESLFCVSWAQGLIYLCDYLGLLGTVQEHGRQDLKKSKEYQGTPQDLLELRLFMRKMLLEPSPEQIREKRKGEGKERLASVQTGAAFQMILLHQNQLFKMNRMYGIWVKLQGWVGIAAPPAVCRGVMVVKTKLYIYF